MLAVGRQAAGDRDRRGRCLAEPAHQRLAVDIEAFGKDQHVHEIGPGQLRGERRAGGGAARGGDRRRSRRAPWCDRMHRGRDGALVEHFGAVDLPGGGAADANRGAASCAGEVVGECGLPSDSTMAEGEDQLRVGDGRRVLASRFDSDQGICSTFMAPALGAANITLL